MAAHQAPLSLGFSRQEHWRGLTFPSPVHESEKWKWSHSVVSDSSRPHGLQPTRLLRPWDFPGKERWSGVPLPSLLFSAKCFGIFPFTFKPSMYSMYLSDTFMYIGINFNFLMWIANCPENTNLCNNCQILALQMFYIKFLYKINR